ncbi:hypothetical protein [Pantoea dispersa]|uniref:hypothetical protein n=1 Tax=Pantoea dispersa TaxID=59814 RepID=UPI0024AED411|nr:hypothetical protein [Pantoea dispersa]MDI6634353.1 hypothetical protein [Pantoea dispersa]
MKRNLLVFALMYSSFSNADDKALDLPVIAPLSANVETSYPAVSDFYRTCSNGANSDETRQSRAEWSYCSGFMGAAMQAASRNGNGTCPPVTLRKVLNVIDSDNQEYQSSHSDPIYDKSGKVVAFTLHPDFVDPWKSPAFPILVNTLKKIGCK